MDNIKSPILNYKVTLDTGYSFEYSYDSGWEMQSLICPLFITSPDYLPSGATLTFKNHQDPNLVSVHCSRLGPIGAFPKEVLDDYSNLGYIKWNACFHKDKGKAIVWIELK